MKKNLYLAVFLLVISCKWAEIPIERVRLVPLSEMDQFSDSTFFSDIRFMYANQGLLYLSDYTRAQVMVLDNETLIETISSKGQGPGELFGASPLLVRDDTVYIHDSGKRENSCFLQRQLFTIHQSSVVCI
ncbi:hypothetical protein FACS1894182_12230 [Bacteroidia bacterium]|nr:hypothetical protein FACS1894182_12230 [Bacteroidia bacterium]